MIAIGEMEDRILSELQEAGEENVAALINTIINPMGDTIELIQLRQALDNLARKGLVRIALTRDATRGLVPLSVDKSLEIVAKIDEFLRFRSSDSHWTWSGESKPHIVVTAEGRARADKILDQRGYQWWRRGEDDAS
jgi:hypothetical protein